MRPEPFHKPGMVVRVVEMPGGYGARNVIDHVVVEGRTYVGAGSVSWELRVRVVASNEPLRCGLRYACHPPADAMPGDDVEEFRVMWVAPSEQVIFNALPPRTVPQGWASTDPARSDGTPEER